MKEALKASDVTIYGILFDTPLYTRINFQNIHGDSTKLYCIDEGEFQLDAYCIHCERDVPFETVRFGSVQSFSSYAAETRNNRKIGVPVERAWRGALPLRCKRVPEHTYTFWFDFQDAHLMKIGQYPSIEDVSSPDLKRFQGILSKGDFAELKRATGLAAHGIGVGAYVYLRRIFERQLHNHHKAYAVTTGAPILDFETMHVEKKIAALASVLPPAMAQFSQAYGFLSKGIHELDEETCRVHFPVLKAVIMAILEQDYQEREKKKAAEKLRIEMERAVSAINSPKSISDSDPNPG